LKWASQPEETPETGLTELPDCQSEPAQLPGIVSTAYSVVRVRDTIDVPGAEVSAQTSVIDESVMAVSVPTAGLEKVAIGASELARMVLEAVYVVLAAESVRATTNR
jgi:hypothetical protein